MWQEAAEKRQRQADEQDQKDREEAYRAYMKEKAQKRLDDMNALRAGEYEKERISVLDGTFDKYVEEIQNKASLALEDERFAVLHDRLRRGLERAENATRHDQVLRAHKQLQEVVILAEGIFRGLYP